MKCILHPAADEEFAQAVQYYSEIDSQLGVRFYREIERMIRDVCAHPDRYSRFDPPARRIITADFPYAVVYLQKEDHIWIVAVMHMKREPGYWRRRLHK